MAVKKDADSCCGGKSVSIRESKPCCNPAVDVAGLQSMPQAAPDHSVPFSSCLPGVYWVKGSVDTPFGGIPRVGTSLTFRDTLGSWKARWGINRMSYTISPGLYSAGEPDDTSPVLVTANYKMSFDRLRKELDGVDAWIMVLDTKGINVWCAAGKGTFGTEEIIRRISAVQLSQVVSHRVIVLPQLGAPGLAAHEVRKRSGFTVIYGPVRARDIKEFFRAGMKATRQMRTVEFSLSDRLVLTPIEVVHTLKPLVLIAAALLIIHFTGLVTISFSALYPFIGAIAIGTVISPVLLPWIPGRAFSLKGCLTGLVWALLVLCLKGGSFQHGGILNGLSLLLFLPAISAFLTLNFTGASTYTSLSGVKREMKVAIPAIIASASTGVGLWLVGYFV